jgi:DNA-binding transcriptional regulator LsrR (DeoR family)
MSRSLATCFPGIGAPPNPEDNDRENYAGEFEISTHLGKCQVVGDICARYFRSNGEILKDDYYDRIVGVPVEDLRAAKRTVFVVSGVEKARAVAGALHTGIVKTLVLDEPTAKAVFSVLAEE